MVWWDSNMQRDASPFEDWSVAATAAWVAEQLPPHAAHLAQVRERDTMHD